MAFASLAGLLFQSSIYPTYELRSAFLANEVINLLIGLPILLGSMGLTRRGSLAGLLLWPGALLYILYNYYCISHRHAIRLDISSFTWHLFY